MEKLGEEEAGPAVGRTPEPEALVPTWKLLSPCGSSVEGPWALCMHEGTLPPELPWGAATRTGRRKPLRADSRASEVFSSVSCRVGILSLTFIFLLPEVLRWGEGMARRPCGLPGRPEGVMSQDSFPWWDLCGPERGNSHHM